MTKEVMSDDFAKWFRGATGYASPQAWQLELAGSADCSNRLIRIPTGLGKTLGVLSAWLFHRVVQPKSNWPRRLVWCLPMRTLVEQTTSEAQKIVAQAGMKDRVEVHRLLGGVEENQWYANPEREAILVGTQDMLLSRALNRGYAMGRAAWPRAFGLINCDALWVMDEVQLMGVGLTTGSQIQAFWEHHKTKGDSSNRFPRATWWMSATLQPDWLRTPETVTMVDELASSALRIKEHDRNGVLWEARKSLSIEAINPKEAADLVAQSHETHAADTETGRQTLVVVNRVQTAKDLFHSLQKLFRNSDSAPDLRLVHSRFRPYERASWLSNFLSRESLGPQLNRIVVATQVVEAGVDISASCLVTELAPWTSLVQRFGRAARYGGKAKIIVLDANYADEKKAAPYAIPELNAAREALKEIDDVAIRRLEEFEDRLKEEDPARLAELYPFKPLHVLLAHEFEELFDTSSDLSGADMDVSRFIREGDERDLHVFWRNFDERSLSKEIQPHRDELCAVPIGEAKVWVKKLNENKGVVFSWDYLEGKWAHVRPESLYPGMTLLVLASAGGYDVDVGFTGDKPSKESKNLDISRKFRPLKHPAPGLPTAATLRKALAKSHCGKQSLLIAAKLATKPTS